MASSFGFSATKEGTVDFKRGGETFQTFYKVFGDLTSAKAPLVVLHGGPGLTHDYLLPISDLAKSHSIPVVFYDQIGNGRSTHLKEKEPTFWTVDLFIDELLNLLSQLKIESYDILGHSWGGILASEFEVRRKPAGLRHLVISDSLAASALWGKATGELLGGFPKEVAEGMGAGMKDPAKFLAALKTFQAVHVCTVKPVPEPLTHSLDQIFGPNGDPTVAGASYVISSICSYLI
jgi:proline-specific peptidase